jgi:hypothetical protein
MPTGHFTWDGAVGTPRFIPLRENKRHMLRDEITVIFKRRLFLFARQLGAISDTCSVQDVRFRSIELVGYAVSVNKLEQRLRTALR